MRHILPLLVVLLVGCSTVPVTYKFPDAPKELLQECEKLQTIDTPEVLLSQLTTVVVKNYTKFHECSLKVDSWKIWYTEQKAIFDNVNTRH